MSPLPPTAAHPEQPELSLPGSAQFRSQMGHISRHSAVFFAGTLFTAVIGYLFKVFLARVLGAEALGLYALGMTIIGFVGIFNALGIPQAAVRFVAEYTASGRMNELRSFFVRGLAYLGVTNAVLGVAVVVFGPWVATRVYRSPELKNYMPLFALLMVGGAFTGFFGMALQGYKDVSRRTVITNFVGTPLMMLITLVLVHWGFGLWGYIFAQVLAAAAVTAMLAWTVWKLTPAAARHMRFPLHPLETQVLSFSAAVFGIGLLEFLLGQVDKILIGVFINAREVGIYAVASSIVAFIPIALQSVNQIFSPTIADLHARAQRELLGRLYQTLTKWIIGFTLPLATIVIVFARPIMRIFGPDFEAGWIVLVIGTLGQLVNCGTGSVGYLLLMSGNQGRLIRVQTAMTIIMILMNLLLIPKFGILGAAVASALTAIGTNAWNLLEVRQRLGLSPYNRSYGDLVVPSVAVIALAGLARRFAFPGQFGWLYIMLAVAGAYLFFGALAVSLGLSSDDRMILGAIYSKFRGLTGSANG